MNQDLLLETIEKEIKLICKSEYKRFNPLMLPEINLNFLITEILPYLKYIDYKEGYTEQYKKMTIIELSLYVLFNFQKCREGIKIKFISISKN